jgi:hypothetical protein
MAMSSPCHAGGRLNIKLSIHLINVLHKIL